MSAESKNFIQNVSLYNWYWIRIINLNDSSKSYKHKQLENLLALLKRDLQYYQFGKNPKVFIYANQLILPLDAGPFESSKEQLVKYIEPYWKSDYLKLKVQWVSNPSLDVFKFILNPQIGDRFHVDKDNRSIHLFPGGRITGIAHEIGHVLGFPDHYYTTWNTEKCEYQFQINNEDIMSNDIDGRVLPEEWSELARQYTQYR